MSLVHEGTLESSSCAALHVKIDRWTGYREVKQVAKSGAEWVE
jgi:hypothetical protein